MSVFEIPPAPHDSAPFNARDAEQIRSLSQEKDPEIYYEGLLQLGRRWEAEDKLENAAKIYTTIAQGRGGEGGDAALKEIQQRAQGRLDVLHGDSSFGLRVESVVTGFIRESQDYRNIAFLLGGDALLRVARPAVQRLWLARNYTRASRHINPRFFAGDLGNPAWAKAIPGGVPSLTSLEGEMHRRLSLALMSSKPSGYARERIWKWLFEKRPIEDIARSINGTYLTGNVHDLELAQKFVRFYRQLPFFSRPEVRLKAARESLEFRLQMAQAAESIQTQDILKISQWRETSPALASLPHDLAAGKLELMLKYRVEMEAAHPGSAYSLFISPNHSPSKKPQIWILGIPTHLFPGETARHIYLRATDLAHEYEHFRHYRELLVKGRAERLRAEMRAWLEEYLFRMQHGDLDFFTSASLSHPSDFGIYFRIWVEEQIAKP